MLALRLHSDLNSACGSELRIDLAIKEKAPANAPGPRVTKVKSWRLLSASLLCLFNPFLAASEISARGSASLRSKARENLRGYGGCPLGRSSPGPVYRLYLQRPRRFAARNAPESA